MASRKSAQITNRDASPTVLNSPFTGVPARMQSAYARIGAVGTTDVLNDVYRMVEVPSNARIVSVRHFNAALGGSSAGDVGVYRNVRDGGAVVDADLFGSAVSFVSAVNGTEISFESTQYTIAEREQPLWQVLGFTSDPNTTFDIAITLTATVNTSGDIGLYVDFVA